MIKLNKQPEPEILSRKREEWTEEYLVYANSGQEIPQTVRFRYRHTEIKSAIVRETAGKCCYCESKLRHVIPGNIEHIVPVSKCPDKILEWSNLTLACVECNGGKRDYYDPSQPLINPYVDHPGKHLLAAGPFIFHRAGDSMGHLTEKKLKLNRPELLERRRERLMKVNILLDSWVNEQNGLLKNILWREILEEIKPDKEYVFVTREYLRENYNIH